MDQASLRKKQHCAIWLQSCSRTHKLWCDCNNWISHIKWSGITGEDSGHEGSGGLNDDAAMADAAKFAEGLSESDTRYVALISAKSLL
nr:ORF2 [Torque teno felis virus]